MFSLQRRPKQTRPNVTDTGKPVPGMCLGLVFGLGGGGAKASLISESYPDLARLVVRWCGATLPKTKGGKPFPFSSLQVVVARPDGCPGARIAAHTCRGRERIGARTGVRLSAFCFLSGNLSSAPTATPQLSA